jgi:type II secretory pathway pseudopilin PulG
MTKFSLKNRLKRLRALLKRDRGLGFTLLELLVAMFVAGLIVIGLLTLSARITEANQKDAGRSQVQQDMRAAIDYIAQDLREAVFVYNGQCLQGNGTPTVANFGTICPGIVNYIPPEMSSASRFPVLAFWRTSPLPDDIRTLCNTNAPQLASDDSSVVENNPLVQAGVPCVASNSYTLVVYALDTANDRDDNTGIWQGKSRLLRYQLPQFRDGAATQNNQSTGYANPLQSSEFTFQQWPLSVEGGAVVNRQNGGVGGARVAGRPTIGDNQPQVLVDFVDGDPDPTKRTPDPIDAPAKLAPNCEEFGGDTTAQANALSPLIGTFPQPNRGFYACVRGGGINPPVLAGTPPPPVDNQEVQITLTGSVAGYPGYPIGNDGDARLSPVQTRVLIRGVLQKG